MSAKVQSVAAAGVGGILVDIECHVSNGLPGIVIVGFANKSVDEAKERLRSAFSNSKLDMPRKRITLNLAPADIPKDGTSFDAAMAAAILIASNQCQLRLGRKDAVFGELSLDGSVRAVRGVIGKLLTGRDQGINNFYIPTANLLQAQLIPGITLFPFGSIRDLYLHLTDTAPIKPIHTGSGRAPLPGSSSHNDFIEVVGQARAKRALEIAAAGGHNILLNGPPGTGKSMLAKALPSILPPLNHEEILEVTHLHSLASHNYDHIVTERPFRAPHHSASDTSIIGGGQNPKPGEISLSHHGVLFFDELPEFSRNTIEALRQPLEDRVITIARAKDSLTFPARFILVATSNPCPCGYYGTKKECICPPHQIARYQRKLSGPILDRIDMYIDVEEVQHSKLLLRNSSAEPSSKVLKRVLEARKRQALRYGNDTALNGSLGNEGVKKFGNLTMEARELLNQAADRLQISARSYMRLIKVGRTIADIEGSETVDSQHITEALQYRRPLQDIFN